MLEQLLRAAKKNYNRKEIDKVKKNNCKLWWVLNELIERKKPLEKFDSIEIGDRCVQTQK